MTDEDHNNNSEGVKDLLTNTKDSTGNYEKADIEKNKTMAALFQKQKNGSIVLNLDQGQYYFKHIVPKIEQCQYCLKHIIPKIEQC